jgi:hypothetical protein
VWHIDEKNFDRQVCLVIIKSPLRPIQKPTFSLAEIFLMVFLIILSSPITLKTFVKTSAKECFSYSAPTLETFMFPLKFMKTSKQVISTLRFGVG